MEKRSFRTSRGHLRMVCWAAALFSLAVLALSLYRLTQGVEIGGTTIFLTTDELISVEEALTRGPSIATKKSNHSGRIVVVAEPLQSVTIVEAFGRTLRWYRIR